MSRAKRDTGRGWHVGKVGVRGEDSMSGRSGCGERMACREGRGEENLGKQAHFLNSEKKTRPV